jgi:quercetin dioxygenase-like cupin family protein
MDHCCQGYLAWAMEERSRAVARSGDVLEHPVTGERIMWRRVARESNGELLQAELFAVPGGHPAAAHVHPYQEERFEVLAGTLQLVVDGRRTTLEPGDVAVVPQGRSHTWSNIGNEEARVLGEFRPALRTEMFFETFFGLAKDGKVNSKGLPNLLRMAVIMREYDEEILLARPPAAVQRALFAPLAALGHLLGYRGWYPDYSSDPLGRIRPSS